MRQTDVLIVGLGPTGATLAILLAQWGIEAIAIDRDREIYQLPRAAHFDHEIMRVFQQLGIADAMLPHTRAISSYEFRTAAGELLLNIQQRDAPALSGWRTSYMFHQPALEEALRAKLAEHAAVEVQLGASLAGIERNGERGVLARIARDDGSEEAVHARFLIGCDGGASPTRQMTGIGLFDYGFDEPWLVIDALVQDESMLPQCALQMCDPKRPTTVMPMSPGRRRWEFMLRPDETPEAMLNDDVIARLIEPWMNPKDANIIRKAVYRFHGLVAAKWREQSVLIAGDAAHQMPPFLGQGMCSGIRDAASLAWRLALVLRHGASDAILDDYQSEREPHVRAIVQIAIGMGRMVCTMDEKAAAARDAEMLSRKADRDAPDAAPRLPSLGEGFFHPSPRAGEMFPQPQATDDVRFDDAAGLGFWLVTKNGTAPPLPAYVRRPEVTPDAQHWLDEAGADAVLVRPDRYVFGTGTPQTLLGALREQLG